MNQSSPLVFAFVLIFAFVLPLISFRSLVMSGEGGSSSTSSPSLPAWRPGARLPARVGQGTARFRRLPGGITRG
jgi:hypothetical protein